MKKYLNQAIIFAVYGLLAGVYFREFTKFNGFTARTTLGFAHVHILTLGLAFYLIVAILVKVLNVDYKVTMVSNRIYTIGLIIATLMMLTRGTLEVLGTEITGGLSGAISGIAGIGHIMVAVGMIKFLLVFKKSC